MHAVWWCVALGLFSFIILTCEGAKEQLSTPIHTATS